MDLIKFSWNLHFKGPNKMIKVKEEEVLDFKHLLISVINKA